jgi:polysaccharide pyruvyl transferase WcaK-like protein
MKAKSLFTKLGLTDVVADAAKALFDSAKSQLDTDRLLQKSMAGFIEVAASRYALDAGDTWKPGMPLKLLLAGYSGTRNTGADVRVEEMIRQFRHLFGDDHLDLSILTIDPELSKGYFRTVKQLHLPQIFPKFLFDTIHRQHGVIACEGSMFKSKFANALATMMVGALGLASAEGKLSIGYGGEAGAMDPSLRELVRSYCQDALIIVRNVESQKVLAELGVPSKPGTDTAWTFAPAPASVGRRHLMDAGWDGKKRVLAVVPINPFWWPVRPDVVKGAMWAVSGAYEDSHYDSVYFHKSGEEVDAKQSRYIDGLAGAIERFSANHEVFPILVGMEMLDRKACEALNERLGGGVPMFVSDEWEMYELVSIIRQASMMLSSRYHAVVTSMPGLVPSAGVTMDERIRNLMTDRGQRHLALEVDDPKLAEHAHEVLLELWSEGDRIADGIGRCVVENLERMGRMGMDLVDYVRAMHPSFPFREELGGHGDPWAHLPPLPPEVAALVAKHRPAAASATHAARSSHGLSLPEAS